jgi:hypothetical protein
MTASKLFPKTYKGKEDTGGYLAENTRPTSRNSPQYRGRFYITGIGWFWLSGWRRAGKSGELISLTGRGLTDQEAEQYCAPRNEKKAKETPGNTGDDEDYGKGDIPF